MGMYYAVFTIMLSFMAIILIWGGAALGNNWIMYMLAAVIIIAIIASSRLVAYVRSSTGG